MIGDKLNEATTVGTRNAAKTTAEPLSRRRTTRPEQP